MRPSTVRQRLVVLAAIALPSPAAGHSGGLPGPLPITVDFKKAPVGSWAEYGMKVGAEGNVTLKTRWAFLGRDAGGNTLELEMQGPAMTLSPAPEATRLGKVVTRMVLLPDPIGSGKPIRQLIMQIGDRDPIEIPLELPGLPGHKFQNPDPKKRLGSEEITVGARAFQTSHYRDVLDDTTVDSWVSEEIPPLGVVKIVSTPRPGAVGPGGRPLPVVTMELIAHGKDARSAITRPVRPLDPAASGKK